MAKLEGEDIYLEAPNKPVFFCTTPRGGYRLISAGASLPAAEAFQVSPSLSRVIAHSKATFIAKPRDLEIGVSLLLPQKGDFETRQVDFFEGEHALFDKFRKVRGEDEILAFACKYGELCTKGQKEYSMDFKAEEGKTVYLESTALWEREIKDVNEVVSMWENEAPNIEIARVLNRKLGEYPAVLHYGIDKQGNFFSLFYAHSLAAAIWIQLAQSICRDAPNGMIAGRDFLTGIYYEKGCLATRNKGPHKGKLYHPRNKRNLYRQRNTRKEAEKAGRIVKENRKGRTEFLVEEF